MLYTFTNKQVNPDLLTQQLAAVRAFAFFTITNDNPAKIGVMCLDDTHALGPLSGSEIVAIGKIIADHDATQVLPSQQAAQQKATTVSVLRVQLRQLALADPATITAQDVRNGLLTLVKYLNNQDVI